MSEPCSKGTRQAAAKPGGEEAPRAWVRAPLPPKDPASAKRPGGGRSKGRAAYVRELEGGGCLVLDEDGGHKVVAKFSPPEGDGWVALHDEQTLQPEETAGNRWKSKQERKAKALEHEAFEGPRRPSARRSREGG